MFPSFILIISLNSLKSSLAWGINKISHTVFIWFTLHVCNVTEIIITMKKHVALMDTILLEELVNWTDSLWRELFSQNVKYNLMEIKIKNSSLQPTW